MLPEEVKEDYVGEIMGQNVTNRLIIFQMRIRICVSYNTCLCTASCTERVDKKQSESERLLQQRRLASGSPFNPQMTYLDSFMFAWRRIKKALHFPFYRLGTHVSAALPESALI